jgi:hypothetical protein
VTSTCATSTSRPIFRAIVSETLGLASESFAAGDPLSLHIHGVPFDPHLVGGYIHRDGPAPEPAGAHVETREVQRALDDMAHERSRREWRPPVITGILKRIKAPSTFAMSTRSRSMTTHVIAPGDSSDALVTGTYPSSIPRGFGTRR